MSEIRVELPAAERQPIAKPGRADFHAENSLDTAHRITTARL
jgi:hypothetical protein